MLGINENIIREVKSFAIEQLKALPDDLLFHNIEHTREVVSAVWEIGTISKLSSQQITNIEVAAWLHDLGHKVKYIGHESESIKIAHLFLIERYIDPEVVCLVEECIRSTKLPQSPVNVFQEILCDADLYHLSTKECLEKGALLRKELELKLGKIVDDECWDRTNLLFLKNHKYFTGYGKDILQTRKEKNTLSRLRRQIVERKISENSKF